MRSITLFIAILIAYSSFSNERFLDSLKNLIITSKDPVVEIGHIIDVGDYYYSVNTDSSIVYWERAIEEADKLLDAKHDSVSNILAYKAAAFNNLGAVSLRKGNVDLALEFMIKSLKIKEDLDDKGGIGTTCNNIAYILGNQNDTATAMEYFQKSLKVRREINDSSGISQVYNNLGYMYYKYTDFEKALSYYLQSLEIRIAIEDKVGMANNYNNIGLVHYDMGNIDQAETFYLNALDLYREIGHELNAGHVLANLAGIYADRKEFEKGLKCGEEAFMIAEKFDYTEAIMTSALVCSDIAHRMGMYKDAYQYFATYVRAKDTLQNLETQGAVLKRQMEYEHEKELFADSVERAIEKELDDLKIKEQESKLKKARMQQILLWGGIALAFVIVLLLIRTNRIKKRDNLIIQQQKNEVEEQKTEIEYQRQILEEKNNEITDSINYAQRIQKAILPPDKAIAESLPESFVFYLPKDIVAGDFYWMEKIDDKLIFAVADCTGHGVPGALVSVVCHNALNRSLHEFKITQPDQILNKTRELVIETFEKSEEEVKDGMDIALCSLDLKTYEMQFSGANNGLYIINNKELKEIKPDKQPVGKYLKAKPFTNHTIQLQPEDSIYIFSDGYADQFGGPSGKKFKYGQFKELLISVVDKPMEEQKQIVQNAFESWKGEMAQVDDVCIIGFKTSQKAV